MIMIPMAGLSSRFSLAGYALPKYMLDLHGRCVFDHAVGSFKAYFESEPFTFVVLDDGHSAAFVRARVDALGIRRAEVVALETPTRGQAETVMLGLQRSSSSGDEPLTIFNIDTFRPDFHYPREFDSKAVDGYLEVFHGSGANWSYVRPDSTRPWSVAETAEKRPLSTLCCTGLYHFGSAELFRRAYLPSADKSASELDAGELYVAPLYNALIARGADIRYSVVDPDQVIFCGVPAEYEALRDSPAEVLAPLIPLIATKST